MSKLKINEELFLEKAELLRFEQGLRENGFIFQKQADTAHWGIIRNKFIDPEFYFFQVIATANNDKFRIRNGYAFDKDGLIIKYKEENKDIQIPTAGQKYWLKISHKYDTREVGIVNVGGTNKSLISGTGTKFTEVLRGQPNFPSKIRFLNSIYYPLEYEVLEVIDDTNILIQGVFDIPENNLEYIVVGTFTPGVQPLPQHKEIFLYDDCKLDIILDNGTFPSLIQGKEFIIGSVLYDNSGIKIEDYRWNYIVEDYTHYKVDSISTVNKLTAIEKVKKISAGYSGRNTYVVGFDFKFNITGEVQNNSLSIINVTSGFGGAWKDTTYFSDGDFDGWRYYYQDGNYSTILKSTYNQGTIICLVDSVRLNSGSGTCITPNCEDIQITMKFMNNSNGIIFEKTNYYPINTKAPSFIITADEVIVNNQRVKMFFDMKNHFKYTDIQIFNVNTYYNDNAYDINGNLIDPSQTTTDTDVILNNNISQTVTIVPLRIPLPWYPENSTHLTDYFNASGLGKPNTPFTGWAMCNGANTTPDLRGRFIVGAINNVQTGGSTLAPEVDPLVAGNTNFSYSNTGGKQKVQLTTAEIPSHNHNITVTDPGHKHLTAPGWAIHSDNDGAGSSLTDTPSNPDAVDYDTATNDGLQNSQTGISVSMDGAGGDQRHENLPPYFSCIWVMRIV